MRHPIYFTYGLLLIALAGFSQYRGWSLMKVNEVRNVPKSIRDNPGAYRSIYAGYPRYIGGK
jgi:hypothetical protein